MIIAGELTINGLDAYTKWGVFLDDTGIAHLMTPAPLKEYITNKSPLRHGKEVVPVTPKVDERDVTLVLNIVGRTRTDFLTNYANFIAVLQSGDITIQTRYTNDVYHMKYVSCQQFSSWRGGIGKFTLKLNEPNPMNRT